MSYPIPQKANNVQIEIKKSRFIAFVKHISSREEGMAWLSELKSEYKDARHHCWAYQLGNPSCSTNAGMGDDGEPSGTAGKPILNILRHKQVGDIMIIVVRYFGGIKLGAGGLTRAYSQAAQSVMEVLTTEQAVEMDQVSIICDFALEQQIRHWIGLLDGLVESVDYGQQVTMVITVPQEETDGFVTQLESTLCEFKVVY